MTNGSFDGKSGADDEIFIEEVVVRRGPHLHLKESSKLKPSSDQLVTSVGHTPPTFHRE